MASKGMKNLFGGLFGGKPKQDERSKNTPPNVTAPRAREKEMIALLDKLELDHPQNKLSREKMEELNIQGVINYARSELHFPFITEFDTKNLDANMKQIIAELKRAVEEGYEMTAEWACTALVCAIKSLRVDIPEADMNNGEALMECRVQYSENLRLLVEVCREYDFTANNLADQRDRRQEKRTALDNAKNRYQARRDSGALDIALGELETKVHAPATMSDEAMALRDELNNIHLLKASLIEVDTDINAKQLTLNNRKAEIESRRNALATPPHAVDPKLQDRINEANRIYREKLRDELNNAEKAMRDHDVHISAMTEIGNHSALIVSVTRAREIAKEMELEKYQQMLAEKQAAELQARAAENVAAIEQALREQHAEHERILEQRRNINITYEPVVNTEVNVLTEFE